jgi:hypothetical protein
VNLLEQDWDRAINPNGKKLDHKMPPLTKQMMRLFFYMGWSSGAGRVMAAGRLLDETSQMMAIMAIMDCIDNDKRFLGQPKEELVGPDPDDIPSVN